MVTITQLRGIRYCERSKLFLTLFYTYFEIWCLQIEFVYPQSFYESFVIEWNGLLHCNLLGKGLMHFIKIMIRNDSVKLLNSTHNTFYLETANQPLKFSICNAYIIAFFATSGLDYHYRLLPWNFHSEFWRSKKPSVISYQQLYFSLPHVFSLQKPHTVINEPHTVINVLVD